MLKQLDDFRAVYHDIKRNALNCGNSIVVFVGPDADSICSCRILTLYQLVGLLTLTPKPHLQTLFKADFLMYTIRPVRGYTDLLAGKDELGRNDDLRSVVFLNCGGCADLVSLFGPSEPDGEDEGVESEPGILDRQDVHFYVIDSHRPLHLNNIYSDKITLLDDGTVQSVDIAWMNELEVDFEDEEGSEDGDGVSEKPDGEGENDARSTAGAEDGAEEEDAESQENVDDSDNEAEHDAKRQKLSAQEADNLKREKRRQWRKRYSTYCKETHFGKASSLLLHSLCEQLNKSENDLMWLAIVGMTDQYVHERVDRDRYTQYVAEMTEAVMSRNADRVKETRAADGTPIPVAEKGHLTFEEEFRFMMYRHWNLYDSMYHSSYMATRLGIWSEQGKRKLNTLIAKLGVPLESCKQLYSFMDSDYKARLRNNLEQVAQTYGMDEIFYGSFVKTEGFRLQASAADVVYSTTALVEATSTVEEENSDKFWAAYDATMGCSEAFREGLKLAMDLQKAIVAQGVSILEKKGVNGSGSFRFAYVTPSSNRALFCEPLALTRLALFMVDALKMKSTKEKPFLILSPIEKKNTTLIVGVNALSKFGEFVKNKFGQAFRDATVRAKAAVKHDGFDSSVIEVAQDDVQTFLEYLHLTITA